MSRSYDSGKRAAQAEETKRRILQALVDLLVEELPATIAIPQVAMRAGVSVRIVYHYFPNKEALFDAVVDAMPSLAIVEEAYRDLRPSTPDEFIAALPIVYGHLEANRALFRALSVSEFSDRARTRRRTERLSRIDTAFAPLLDRLNEEERRKLRAAIGALVSFAGYDALTATWGLTTKEAAEVSAWAVRAMCAKARRSGVAR